MGITRVRLHAVAFPETEAVHRDTMWCVQGLQHDLCSQGVGLENAIESFRRVLTGQVVVDRAHKRRPVVYIAPAPKAYWTAYRRGKHNRAFKLAIEGVLFDVRIHENHKFVPYNSTAD